MGREDAYKTGVEESRSFFLTVLGRFFTSFSTFLGMYFMLSRFNTVEGFTFEEVLLCFATVLMAFSLSEMPARGFDMFPRMLGNGEFDRALVRPRNIIFLVLASKMDFTRLGRLSQAILVFCYAIPKSGVVWTWDKIITLFSNDELRQPGIFRTVSHICGLFVLGS